MIRDPDDKSTRPDDDEDGDDGQDEPRTPESPPLKERVIHTRVPVALDDALKKFALSMRVPVSNLVRVLLEDAVTVAQRATDRVAEAAEQAADAAEQAAARATQPAKGPAKKKASTEGDSLVGVFGYQPLTLAIDTRCARCATALGVGDDAFVGLRDGPGPRVFVCAPCLPKPKESKS